MSGSDLRHQILTSMTNIKFRHNFQFKRKLFLPCLLPLFFNSVTILISKVATNCLDN